jgi:hypothetical protein
MEYDIDILSKLDEENLLVILLHLLSKHSTFKINLRSPRRFGKVIGSHNTYTSIQRYLSPHTISIPKVPRRSTIEVTYSRNASFRNTPRTKSSPYTIEQTLVFQNIFIRLLDIYSKTHWVRLNPDKEIHIALIKQFLLDCYTTDLNFFNLILTPVSKKIWVDSNSFVKCFESIHSTPGWTFFPSKRSSRDNKNNLLKQKLICKPYLVFFCVARYESNEDLDREGLKKVLSMVEKRTNVHLEICVDDYFDRNKHMSGNSATRISFKNYYKIVMGQ